MDSPMLLGGSWQLLNKVGAALRRHLQILLIANPFLLSPPHFSSNYFSHLSFISPPAISSFLSCRYPSPPSLLTLVVPSLCNWVLTMLHIAWHQKGTMPNTSLPKFTKTVHFQLIFSRNQVSTCSEKAEILAAWKFLEITASSGVFSLFWSTWNVKFSLNQGSTCSDQAEILAAWIFLEIPTMAFSAYFEQLEMYNSHALIFYQQLRENDTVQVNQNE